MKKVGYVLLALVLIVLCSRIKPSKTASSEDPQRLALEKAVEEAEKHVEMCAIYRIQAQELARDIRYAKVTPWEANGKVNEIKDAMARHDCENAVRELGKARRALNPDSPPTKPIASSKKQPAPKRRPVASASSRVPSPEAPPVEHDLDPYGLSAPAASASQ